MPYRPSACNDPLTVSFLFLAVPTELAGGRYPAPAWVILTLGAVVVIGAAIYLGVLFGRRKDKR